MNSQVIDNSGGFTLVELVLVIVIMAILASVAIQKLGPMMDTFKTEETKSEMDRLATAIVGNPELRNNGIRSDFGYVGDVGALPPNLDALVSDPGFSTWQGPYIDNRFTQDPDDYKRDAWQAEYSYSGGTVISSVGSGGTIDRRLAGSTDFILNNRVSGNIYDSDGTPPGSDFADSLNIQLTLPDGIGSMTVLSTAPDIGGYFAFDSIPIGNHLLNIIYMPTADTIKRFTSVHPGSDLYSEYYLLSNLWSGGSPGGFNKVPGSDSLYDDCHGLFFWVENNAGSAIDIDFLTLTWSTPEAYYRDVIWDGSTVFSRVNPKAASGGMIIFGSTLTINDSQSLRIDFNTFKSNPTGGGNVDMDNVNFSVEFSDGTIMTVSTGNCP